MNNSKISFDDNIIPAFRQGCHKAFSRVFNGFYPVLIGFAGSLVEEFVAEDIVMELFTKLWNKHTTFHSLYSIKGFLFISTRNACLNHLAQNKFRNKVKQDIQRFSRIEEDYVLNKMVKNEIFGEWYNEIENLPQQCKIIFIKRLCGKNYKKIAHELQISPHTVRNQYVRGRDLVNRRLEWREILANKRIEQFL